MITYKSPQEWQPPQWHADFGDSTAELEHLREIAIAISRVTHNVEICLDISEPGVMQLQFRISDSVHAEIHSIPVLQKCGDRRFAIFVSPGTSAEMEEYFDSVGNAVEFIAELETGTGTGGWTTKVSPIEEATQGLGI